jgi:uncharacterized protein (DUF111 family)
MRIEATGFGAGSRDIDGLPNCTQVVIGEAIAVEEGDGQPMVVLETNLDDATGETLAHAVEMLLDAGAVDAWITPVVMKKGRPGHIVSALADPALVPAVRRVLRAETGSLGVRSWPLERWAARREMGSVEVDGMAVRVKVGPGRVKAEHADAARVAARTGRPLRDVVFEAETRWHQGASGPGAEERPGPVPDGPEPA